MHDDKSKNIKKFSLFMGKKFDIIELNWLIISKKGGEKNMAYWNLAFDCATIFFLLLIFVWYFIEKRIPFISHRIFFTFSGSCIRFDGVRSNWCRVLFESAKCE